MLNQNNMMAFKQARQCIVAKEFQEARKFKASIATSDESALLEADMSLWQK